MRKNNSKAMKRASNYSKGRNVSAQGFTLIETVIAMLVMTVVGLGVASAFFYAASNTGNAADREMAIAVAQQRLEQLRSVAFTDASLNATSASGVATTVTRAGRAYSITTIIADTNVISGRATLKTLTIKVAPQVSSQSWTTLTSSLFGSVTLVTERSSQVLGPNRSL
jgi:prepilin-type N-terminal cleavage/methylation domain-containing protein